VSKKKKMQNGITKRGWRDNRQRGNCGTRRDEKNWMGSHACEKTEKTKIEPEPKCTGEKKTGIWGGCGGVKVR